MRCPVIVRLYLLIAGESNLSYVSEYVAVCTIHSHFLAEVHIVSLVISLVLTTKVTMFKLQDGALKYDRPVGLS